MSTFTLNINLIPNAMAQYEYNDHKYSNYPTPITKYECQKGPFEGYFVSSVEFCKFNKFDNDRKDNRDNKTGTQGPSGITQLDNTTTYNITAPIVVSVVGDNAVGEGFAICDSGDFAISGGYTLNNQSPQAVEFFTVTDSPLNDNAWKVRTFSNFEDVDVGGNVTAKCFDNPP
jgi:hypothetical protein